MNNNEDWLKRASEESVRIYRRQEKWRWVRRICMILIIAATAFVGIYQDLYMSRTFMVFGIAVVVLALLCYVVCPLWVEKAYLNTRIYRFPHPEDFRHEFWGWFGTGEVLLGHFEDDITYDFFCIFYMPIFPIKCYTHSGRGMSLAMSWREVLYIYLRQWLIAIIVLCSLVIFS